MIYPRVAAIASLVATAALTTCRARDTTGPPVPATLERVSANRQAGQAGQPLPQPLVVAVTTAAGAGVAGVSVTWSVTAGNGSVSAPFTTTDAQGHAAVVFTLGPTAGADVDTVTASATGLAGSPIIFSASGTAGPPTQLVRVSGDGQADTVGRTLPDSLVVEARDQFANPTAGALVTWAVTDGGGSLSAGSGVTDTAGRTATAWKLGDSTGVQYASATLAGAGGPVVFAATAVALPPNHLLFTVQPTQVEAGGVLTPHVQVTVLDGTGATVTGFTDSVTVALGANPGGASLLGTLRIPAVSGVATFDDLILEKAASGYTLVASAAGLAPGTSAAFDVVAGSATQLVFTVQPGSDTAGATLSPIQVIARDAFGNTAQGFTGDVTVALSTNPGNATLNGTTTVTAASGIATFDDLSVDKSGTGYVLTASAATLPSATSAAFDIAPGTASQLVFTVQPTSAETSAVITPAVEVTALDAHGNTATGFTDMVTVSIGTNPAGGTLSGTTATAAVAGVAGFADLRIDKSGTGYTLQASSGSRVASSATFDVTLPPPAGSVAIAAGDAQTGLAGYPLNVAPAVVVLDGSNAPLAGATVTFAVTSGGGGVTGATTTTDVNGIATVGAWSVQLGSNTLTATVAAAGITGNPVTFSATGVAAAYHIDVRFLTTTTPGRQAAFTDAAATWETLIYGDVPDVQLNIGAGMCGANAPAIHETIDDIVILATIDSIDGPGKILGQAGPCFIRTSSDLPVLGVMMFDSADVAQLEADGQFGTVILHEMGHVLGYGTIWSALGVLAGAGGSDPHFTGPQAIAAFDDNGGLDYTGGAKVPVENCVGFPPGACGSGTRDSHWRESVFDNELMTGFLNGGVPNPLSVITTASMGDLGYTVNYAGSAPYSVANPLAAIRAAGSQALELRDDILRLPVFAVDAAGHVVNVRPPR